MLNRFAQTKENRANFIDAQVPNKRIGTPEEMANASDKRVFSARASDRHLAPGCAVSFSGDVASLIAGQEDVDRGYLRRLRGTPEDGL
jgi:hypothetical protein